jgi:hypothetical protein
MRDGKAGYSKSLIEENAIMAVIRPDFENGRARSAKISICCGLDRKFFLSKKVF